jgi:predicted RNase H-like HicB family nuclease
MEQGRVRTPISFQMGPRSRTLPKNKNTSLSAVLNPEESGGYVALCPELDIASQGESIEQTMHNLKEAVEGFFEVASPAEIETRL